MERQRAIRPEEHAQRHVVYENDLAWVLRSLGVREVAIMGAVTEMCVAETAGDAVRAGWPAIVLRGASVALAGAQEKDALASLAREGVAVVADPEGAPRS